MMLDGAGFRADGKAYGRAPTDLLSQSRCSGHVPLITAVLGSSAGHGALVAPMSDFSVMSSHAAIFTAGPPVVLESLGETVTKEELGGPGVALASGLIHNVAPDDAAALELVRLYLSYFPSSAWSYPPDYVHDDTAPRPVPEIVDIVPRDGRRVYDVRDVIDVVVDQSSWFEVQPDFGKSVVSALAHLGGHPVAVVANQPQVMAGSIDVDGADKASHFITVADSFHLPLVFFADNPGVMPGTASERRGILRAGARHVRGADRRHHTEVRGHAAQGLRVRLDGHGHDRLRQPVGRVRPARRHDGCDGRRGDEPLPGLRRRRGRGPEEDGARGVVPLGAVVRLRRAHRPARDPQRAAALARARVATSGRRRPSRSCAVAITP